MTRLLAVVALAVALAPTGVRAAEATTAAELSTVIDAEVGAKLAAAGVAPAPAADDAEFLRRAYLDLTGTVPPADAVAPFLDSKDAGKRAKLIDDLLASRDHAKHMTAVWRVRLVPDEVVSQFGNRKFMGPLDAWLEESFHANKPWDRMVTELLTFEGKGSVTRGFYTFDTQFATVEQFTNKVGQYFLGVQLSCAQCHNHPYQKELRQTDYWGLAAFFGKMGPGFTEEPKQQEPGQKPDGYKKAAPRFLKGDAPDLKPDEPRRPALARWLTSADNPYFAKAAANRTWAHFFGRGLVNPVDDVGFGSEPSHPKVLAELARQFVLNGFDLKYLARAVCLSDAYQRSSRRPKANPGDPALYGYAVVRGLTPRQLLAARTAVAKGVGLKEKDVLAAFDLTPDLDPTAYPHGILETLRLMNHPGLNDPGVLTKLVKADGPVAANVEALYLCVLARRPTAAEAERAAGHVAKKGKDAYPDLLWVLLNSAEFQVNH